MNQFKQGDMLLFETSDGDKFGYILGGYYDQEQSLNMYFVELQSKRQIFLISQNDIALQIKQIRPLTQTKINKQQQKKYLKKVIPGLSKENKKQESISQNEVKQQIQANIEQIKQDDTQQYVKIKEGYGDIQQKKKVKKQLQPANAEGWRLYNQGNHHDQSVINRTKRSFAQIQVPLSLGDRQKIKPIKIQ